MPMNIEIKDASQAHLCQVRDQIQSLIRADNCAAANKCLPRRSRRDLNVDRGEITRAYYELEVEVSHQGKR